MTGAAAAPPGTARGGEERDNRAQPGSRVFSDRGAEFPNMPGLPKHWQVRLELVLVERPLSEQMGFVAL